MGGAEDYRETNYTEREHLPWRRRVGLTSAGSVRQQHVSVETVALVTPVRVHAPVFTRPRLQAALVQICGETASASGHCRQTDRQEEGEGASYTGVKLARGQRGGGPSCQTSPSHLCVCVCVFGRRLGCHQGSEVLPCSDKPATSTLMLQQEASVDCQPAYYLQVRKHVITPPPPPPPSFTWLWMP